MIITNAAVIAASMNARTRTIEVCLNATNGQIVQCPVNPYYDALIYIIFTMIWIIIIGFGFLYLKDKIFGY